MIESEQVNHMRSVHSDPKVSNFEEGLNVENALKEINIQNRPTKGNRNSDLSKSTKSRAKSIIYYKER